MSIMVLKSKWKINATTQWHTQAVKFMTNNKVKINFFLQEFSAIKIVTWEFHVDEKNKVGIV